MNCRSPAAPAGENAVAFQPDSAWVRSRLGKCGRRPFGGWPSAMARAPCRPMDLVSWLELLAARWDEITAPLDASTTSRLACRPSRDVPGTTRDGAMANERLRAAILRQGLTPDELAELVQVDAKTV